MNKKYVVNYRLPYLHTVEVGIEAPNACMASSRARRHFDNGTLWDDTDCLPLLRNDFDEDAARGAALHFEAKQVGAWPKPEQSVHELRRRVHASNACALLIEAYDAGERAGGSVEWSDLDEAVIAARQALASHPRQADEATRCPAPNARVIVVVRGGVAEVFTSGEVETATVDVDSLEAGDATDLPASFCDMATAAGIGTAILQAARSAA